MFALGLESPSHDELDSAFGGAGLAAGDPAPMRSGQRPSLGKMKRVRAVFNYATDHDPQRGLKLAERLVAVLRAHGAFHVSDEAARTRVDALRRELAIVGYELDASGGLRPTVIDNLHGTALTEALRGYVRRANLMPDDPALQVGTAKELDEATARHVLEEKVGSYSPSANFPYTLFNAFTQLGLTPADPATGNTLASDPHEAVQQCLYQLGVAVNRLRNAVGTGHGRPGASARTTSLTAAEARLVTRASALVAAMMLDTLDGP